MSEFLWIYKFTLTVRVYNYRENVSTLNLKRKKALEIQKSNWTLEKYILFNLMFKFAFFCFANLENKPLSPFHLFHLISPNLLIRLNKIEGCSYYLQQLLYFLQVIRFFKGIGTCQITRSVKNLGNEVFAAHYSCINVSRWTGKEKLYVFFSLRAICWNILKRKSFVLMSLSSPVPSVLILSTSVTLHVGENDFVTPNLGSKDTLKIQNTLSKTIKPL